MNYNEDHPYTVALRVNVDDLAACIKDVQTGWSCGFSWVTKVIEHPDVDATIAGVVFKTERFATVLVAMSDHYPFMANKWHDSWNVERESPTDEKEVTA